MVFTDKVFEIETEAMNKKMTNKLYDQASGKNEEDEEEGMHDSFNDEIPIK